MNLYLKLATHWFSVALLYYIPMCPCCRETDINWMLQVGDCETGVWNTPLTLCLRGIELHNRLNIPYLKLVKLRALIIWLKFLNIHSYSPRTCRTYCNNNSHLKGLGDYNSCKIDSSDTKRAWAYESPPACSASSSHLARIDFSLQAFLKLSCRFSKRQMVVWLNSDPCTAARASPTLVWV